jgi:hypothetical protein
MATQFAINEPDSFNSPNATYARLPGSEYVAYTLVPSDIMVGYGTIDYIGDRDYFNTPLPAFRTVVGVLLINGKTHYTFGETVFYGTVTVNVVANNGSPFDGVLTLYAGDGSSVVATGTSLGSGETFLQFNGEGAHSEYTLSCKRTGTIRLALTRSSSTSWDLHAFRRLILRAAPRARPSTGRQPGTMW